MKRFLILVLVCAVGAPAQAKKAMSIENFDYSAVMSAVQSIFGTEMNIGQGIQAMMTKRVASDGRFTVVERRKVDNLTREQVIELNIPTGVPLLYVYDTTGKILEHRYL